jgi:Domain of unknown function (DUF6259)
MFHPVSRRSFLAGVVAGSALTAYGQVARPPRRGKRPPSAPDQDSQEPRIWLPPLRGEGANVPFANSPDWQRNAPGWYVPSTVSAGVCMLDFPLITFLSSLIRDFRQLPSLLDQARSLGTNIVYLVDWFEGKAGAPPYNYWMNKGDYIPRADMGGAAALKEGISALHSRGGRVILYVEGFIINQESQVGRTHGAQWSIMGPKGPPEQPYPGNWKPCPGAEGWLGYIEGVARRIGSYGADGIFLDSQGFQKDWKCMSRKHGHRPGDPEVFNNGCVHLCRRVRAALREGSPDAIVYIEGPTMLRLFDHVDGSLDWGPDTFVRRWLWEDQGRTDTILSSYSLDDWNQIMAIGAKLGVGSQFLKSPPGSSAQDFLAQFLRKELPEKRLDLQHTAHHAFWGLHAWRNAGLILRLPMPGLDDIIPRNWEEMEHVRNRFHEICANRENLHHVLEGLRSRAGAIDEAIAGKRAPSPAEYVKSLMTARARLAPIIDHGSRVELVRTPFPKVVGRRFTGNRGMALTAVSVADVPRPVTFPNTRGVWQDAVTSENFSSREGALTVRVAPHRAVLLHDSTA